MRGRPRSLFYGAVALLVVGSLLAACTSKPRPNTTPHAGGTLDVSIRDLGSLDPAKASGRGALLVVSQIFDSLTAIDPATGFVKPAAAQSWTTSSDGLTWRFTIAAATFQNGQPVRARDFKFALDRVSQKAMRSEIATELEPVAGFRAVHVAGTTRTLAGVSAPSSTLLVIQLDHPYYELPYNLADPGLAPIPFGTYGRSAAGLNTSPVGNGPFKVVSATAASQATLARYDNYHSTKAYLDGIKFHVVANIDDAWRAFQGHRTDITDVPANQVAAGKGFDQRGFTPVWATLSFAPNLKLAKYKDPNVRIAISLAIDRNAIASQVFGSTKDAATGLLPRGVRGYVPGACTTCNFDQDRARTLLNAAFKGKIPAITIDHLGDQGSRLVAQAIANNLNAVGFHASLASYGSDEYKALLAKGKQDFAELGWIQNVPSPDGFIAQLLLTGSINNQSGFSSRSFDSDIANARRQKNEAARLADYAGAERRALGLMPLIPIVFYRNREAVASRVQGFKLDGAGIFDASTIWLA